MGWNRSTARPSRGRCRPGLEALERRQVLSTLAALPASSANPDLNADGSADIDKVTEASAARSTYSVDGAGQSVAVIDTGVDWNNPALGGSMGAGSKVIAGVDFTNSPNGVLPTMQHGTGVAGIIASNQPGDVGVAPGVDIVALRVFGDNGQGSFDNVAKALDWVIANHSAYNITAVNLSISDGGNYLSNRFAQDGDVGQHITTSIKTLDTLNIPVVVATGNSFDGKTQGEGFSSIVADAVSVTATDLSGVTADGAGVKLASDAQRLGAAKGGIYATKIAAPGVNVLAPSGDSGTASENGTSFAAPQVTGGIVLLQQYYEKAYHTLPTVAQLDGWLQGGSTTIHDSVTGIDIGQLDILHSLKLLDGQIEAAAALTAAAKLAVPPAVVSPAVVIPIVTTITTAAPVATITTTAVTAPAVIAAPAPATPPVTTTITISTAEPTVVPVVEVPKTEVILNGTLLGSYSTSDLAAAFAGLFALSKGPVAQIRAWAPAGSVPDLGVSRPSGVSTPIPTTSTATAEARTLAHAPVARLHAPGEVHARAVTHHKKGFFRWPFSW